MINPAEPQETGQRADELPYTVVGAGAIGGTLAVHLHANGVPVQVIDADPDHIAAVRDTGLVVRQPGGELKAELPAYGLEDAPGQLGRVLLAVKAQATEPAIDWIAPRLLPDGYVASLQNGLNEALIADRIGNQRTVIAFVDLFADVIEPGVIKDGGAGAMALGEYAGGTSERVRQLADDLRHWGNPVVSDNVAGFLWSKLAFGAMLTATALADDDMSVLIDRHRTAMTALAAEVLTITDRLGIVPEPFDAFHPGDFGAGADPAATSAGLDAIVGWLATQTKTRSGIWRDIAVRHRPTEVPTHYRPVIAIAAEHDIATPLLTELVHRIEQLEHGVVPMDERHLTDLDLLAAR